MWLIFLIIIMGVVTFLIWGFDKYRARTHGWRVLERWLFALILTGGSLGALAGMVVFHHKTRKPIFWFLVVVSLIVHGLLLLFIAI